MLASTRRHSSFQIVRSFASAKTLAAAALLTALGGLSGCHGGGGGHPYDVAGHFIVCINDADMNASAMSTKSLGPRNPEAQDALTVVSLPILEPSTPFAQLPVSNSALGPPTAVDVSSDGRYAYIVESRGPASANAKTIDDLPIGETMTSVDLTIPLNPKIIGSTYVGPEPTAVAVHPSGDMVAVVTKNPRAQLVVVSVRNGATVGDPFSWPLLGLDDDAAKPSCVAWHPSGSALCVTLPDRGQVIFYQFQRETDGGMSLRTWGKPVSVGKYPYSGAFTPDGRYFITTDLQWGKDVEGFSVGAPQGTLSVVRVDGTPPSSEGRISDQSAAPARHEVVCQTPVGISPEGLAISHDGTMVATSNLLHSYLPENDPHRSPGSQRGGSLSLLTLSREGKLTPVGEFPIDAVPAGLAFDAKDRFLAVTQFHSFDPEARGGELAFWKVNRGKKAGLEQADFYVGVGQGPHGVLIVR